MRLFALYWIQEISPQDIPDRCFSQRSECRKSAAHRNRACDTLHLGWAMWAGTAKRSRLILEVRGKTLGHRRLLCLVCCTASQTQQQGRSSPRSLGKRRFSVLNFLRVRLHVQQRSETVALLRVSLRFRCTVLPRNSRSSSAYVPSARQAGPHAHPL